MEISVTNTTEEPIEIKAGAMIGFSANGNLKIQQVPFLSDILKYLDGDMPQEEVVFYKGASIGMTNCVIPSLDGYYIIPEIK